jgi:YHS domain-containing protein
MKKVWPITPLIIGLVTFTLTTYVGAQQHDHSMHGEAMKPDTEKSVSDKARCAYDGMMMKTSAMLHLKHGDETLYFCNEEQKAAFQKSPKRYLRKLTFDRHHILVNTLTMKEYMDMMQSMGMSMMAKKGNPHDTHWVSAYFLTDGHVVEPPGIAVKVISPAGKTTLQELKYDKMMKTYTGNLSLLDSGEYKLSVLLESSKTTMP